jgi:hypothetical protein
MGGFQAGDAWWVPAKMRLSRKNRMPGFDKILFQYL